MNQKMLVEKLTQAQGLLSECIAMTAQGFKPTCSPPPKATPELAAGKATLPSQILSLRDKSFFKQAKTPQETHAGLQSSYPCELDRVVMALIRLARRRKLRKASKLNGRTRKTAYVW
jgi:hypothetical protein